MPDDLDNLKKRVERIERVLHLSDTNSVEQGFVPEEPPMPKLYRADAVAVPAAEKRDMESYIGQRLLPVLGILAVLFGAAFFLKYAFETNLIGVTGRVMLGLFSGLVFLGIGEYFHSKYPHYSWILSGGGIALLYLSIFAAFAFYNLIGQASAFLFMSVVTLFSGLISIRYNALPLAIIGTLGGFLTPFLVSTGVDNQVALFTYVAILNAGILLVSAFRNWRALNLLGFIGTMFTFLVWFSVHYAPAKLAPTELYLAIFFGEFLLATIAGNLFSQDESKQDDLGLLVLNVSWFFGWSYYLLNPDYGDYMGLFTAAMAALYIALAYVARAVKPADRFLGLFLGAIGLVFLTLVFPIQFEGHWITVAWAVEALALAWICTTMRAEEFRIPAFLILGIAVGRLIVFDTALSSSALFDYALLFNKRVFSYLVVIGAAGAMHILYTKSQDEVDKKSALVAGGVWNILLLVIMSIELQTYFDQRLRMLNESLNAKPDLYYGYYNSPEYRSIRNQANVSLSVLWAIYASVALGVGMAFKNKGVRLGSLGLFALTLAKVVLVDLASLPFGYRFVSFMVLGVLLLAGSYLYYKNQSRISPSS